MLRCRQINVDDTFYGGMRHMREVINFNEMGIYQGSHRSAEGDAGEVVLGNTSTFLE